MRIVISNQSELPIYVQIKEQIKEQIMNGAVAEGTVLPSIRQLAKELGVSVITTTRAYGDLEAEGFVAARQGKGSVVLSRDSQMVMEQYLRRIEDAFVLAIENGRYAGIGEEELVLMLRTLYKEE